MVRTCSHCGQRNRVPASHLSDTGKCGACKAALSPVAEPIDADVELFDDVLRNAKVPALVDFWAQWCGPCRTAAPEIKRLATEVAGRAIVLKVNTEQYPQLAARYGVQAIPNFLVIKNGRVVRQQAGLAPHTQMRRWLQEAAAA